MESERVSNVNSSNNNDCERQRVVLKEEESWLRQWFGQFRNGSNPWMARYVYALFFLLSNFLAWAARDYGTTALTEMESKFFLLVFYLNKLHDMIIIMIYAQF